MYCLSSYHYTLRLTSCVLQAGPLVKTKIPKDPDGKQKTFGFAVYKHEVSVPYAMQLLNGTLLFGKAIHVQFRSGEFESFLYMQAVMCPGMEFLEFVFHTNVVKWT